VPQLNYEIDQPKSAPQLNYEIDQPKSTPAPTQAAIRKAGVRYELRGWGRLLKFRRLASGAQHFLHEPHPLLKMAQPTAPVSVLGSTLEPAGESCEHLVVCEPCADPAPPCILARSKRNRKAPAGHGDYVSAAQECVPVAGNTAPIKKKAKRIDPAWLSAPAQPGTPQLIGGVFDRTPPGWTPASSTSPDASIFASGLRRFRRQKYVRNTTLHSPTKSFSHALPPSQELLTQLGCYEPVDDNFEPLFGAYVQMVTTKPEHHPFKCSKPSPQPRKQEPPLLGGDLGQSFCAALAHNNRFCYFSGCLSAGHHTKVCETAAYEASLTCQGCGYCPNSAAQKSNAVKNHKQHGVTCKVKMHNTGGRGRATRNTECPCIFHRFGCEHMCSRR
jgi:hypothetical protein